MKNELKQSLLKILESQEFNIQIRKAGKFRFPTNYLFGLHSHVEIEMNYIHTGTCVMEIGGELISLKQGECIIIPPQMPHYFMVGLQKVCSIVQLEYKLVLPEEPSKSFEFLKESERFIKIQDGVSVGNIMEGICRCFREAKPTLYTQAQLEFGFAQLYVALAYATESMHKYEADTVTEKSNKLVQYVNQHYDDKLNIEELAEDYGISSRSVRKYFEQSLGMKCSEYITMLRMEKAKTLLWYSQRSITDIAITVGYSSSQYFSNVFRRYTGMTPKKFKSSWRGITAEEKLYE